MPYDQFRASTDASGLPPARVLGVAATACARAAERAGSLLGAPQLRALLRDEQARHPACPQHTCCLIVAASGGGQSKQLSAITCVPTYAVCQERYRACQRPTALPCGPDLFPVASKLHLISGPFLQVRHLEGLQRIATQNAVATKLLAATSVRAAAATAGSQRSEQQGGAAAGGFKASLDFKTALACSNTTFYPSIVLKH